MANETFKLGATKWAYKEGSLLAYNDVNNNFKPLPFTFTRASTATRVNEDGLIEIVKNDVPRIDYTDNPDGHLLLEPERTNLIQYSENFSSGLWQKRGFSVASANVLSPYGELNALQITENNTDNNPALIYAIDLTDGTTRTFSVWLKSSTPTSLALNTNGSSGSITVNVTTEWQRFSVTNSVDSSSGPHVGGFSSITRGSGISLYVAYAQMESGSYATSYIPTNGETNGVTRYPDYCYGAGNAQVFNDSEGVLFADVAALANDGTNRIISVSNGTVNNRIGFQHFGSSDEIRFFVQGSASTSGDYTLSNSLDLNKIAFKYKSGDLALWVNGVEAAIDSTVFSVSSLSEFAFDRGDGVFPFYGKIKQIGVYDAALIDDELEYITGEGYTSFASLVNENNYILV